jgi:hypothetical protein
MSVEHWYFIRGDILYDHQENDGDDWNNYGLQPVDTPLCNLKEAEEKYPKELALAKMDLVKESA